MRSDLHEFAAGVEVPSKKNFIRQLYDWVLHWAETPYGSLALILLAFSESSFFPVPPDVLLIALAISIPRRSFYYAAITSISSIIGGVLGYYIGIGLMEAHFFRCHLMYY